MKGESESNNNKSDGDSIKVFLRVRPPSDLDSSLGKCLTVNPPDTVVVQAVKTETKAYRFDHVANENTTQESVFAAVGKKTVESCIAGYNGTIFAYGQTGSGKTFTMMGPSEEENFEHPLRGVIPRSIDYLFNLIEREREKRGHQFEFLCKCSFLEIYKEQVFDLLDHASNCLQLRENIKHGVYADGLIENAVDNPRDACQVLSKGWINRRVAATSMNRESSRSHAVFTLSIETKEKQGKVSNVRISHLHMVDLAGSERQKDTQAAGQRIKEAGSINSSLSVLGRVISALVDIGQGKNRYVPYRESKLSFLLRDALGGNTKTFIIANVHPGLRQIGETISTLNFARRAKMIKNRAVINEDTLGSVVALHAEIRRLKEELKVFKTSSISHAITDKTDLEPVPSDGGDRKWQTCFFDAMLLWEKCDKANKTVSRKISQFQNLCKKKDNFLMSNKMVIKLRESALYRLQEAQKEKLIPDDRDIRIEHLHQEINILKDQLEHNPTVIQFAMENSNLRTELKALQTSETMLQLKEFTAKKKEQLQKDFQQLTDEIVDLKSGNTPGSASQARVGRTAVATVERFRSQVDALNTQVNVAKQELSEQIELHKRNQIENESQLAVERKTNKELQHALNAIKLKSKMERDEINDLHIQTIKTITTPKKGGYHLRSRLIMQPNGGTPGAPASSLPPFVIDDDAGILEEKMPDHMVEQCNEALTDEVKKLQNKNNELLEQIEKTECERLLFKQTSSKFELQVQQLNQMLDHGRCDWQAEQLQLTNQVSMLSEQLNEMTNQYEVAKYEFEDFKVLLPLAYKELDDAKKVHETVNDKGKQELNCLEERISQIERDMTAKQREMDDLQEEHDRLQDDNGALQAEVAVNDQQVESLQKQCHEHKHHQAQLETEVQSLLEKLEMEMQKSGWLMGEIQVQDSEQKKQLVEALEENMRLTEVTNRANHAYKIQEDDLVKNRDELNKAQTTLTIMQKRADEEKEAISNLMTMVQHLRTDKLAQEGRLASLNTAVEDLQRQCEELKTVEEEQRHNLQEMDGTIVKKEEEMQTQEAAHNMEMEMLKEDLEEATLQADNLREVLCKQSQQATVDLEEQMQKQQHLISEKELEISQIIKHYDEKLKTLESNQHCSVNQTAEVQAQAIQLQTIIEQQSAELVALRESQSQAREVIEQFECSREEKNEEINMLKEQLKEIEKLKIENTEYEDKCCRLEGELEESNERLIQINFLTDELKGQTDRANFGFDSSNKIKDEILEEKIELLKELYDMKLALQETRDSKQQLQGEIERTSALECTAFERKQELESKLEEIIEEKSRLQQDLEKMNKSNDKLRTENAKLVGHQNMKQKIQHHLQIKKDNNKLQEELARLSAEMLILKQEADGVKRKRHCSRIEDTQTPTLKKNSEPHFVIL